MCFSRRLTKNVNVTGGVGGVNEWYQFLILIDGNSESVKPSYGSLSIWGNYIIRPYKYTSGQLNVIP